MDTSNPNVSSIPNPNKVKVIPTPNNDFQPDDPAVERIVITPEMYRTMTPEQRASIPESIRMEWERQLQNPAKPFNCGIPAMVEGSSPAWSPAADEMTREYFCNLPLKARKAIRQNQDEVTGRDLLHFWEVDITNTNDLSLLLAGAVIASAVIFGGYFVLTLMKKND